MITDDQHDFLNPRRGPAPLTPSDLAEQLATDYPQLSIQPDAPLVGGMGAVYRATLSSSTGRRPVAIKVLHWHLMDDPAFTARFQREQALLSTLNHPNIVKLHDTGHTAEGQPFLVMDWVEGDSLTEYTQHNPNPKFNLTRQQLLRIADDLCAATQHAHEKGILHRDLKPQNIIVTQDGRAVLLDFGIARPLSPGHTLTQPGDAPGTHGYIAPEVLAGEKPDARADIYSLGIIIYQLLMKRLPEAFAARPSEHSLDPRFDEIVMKAAASEREKRYASAEALREALGSIRQTENLESIHMNNTPPMKARDQKGPPAARKVEVVVDEIALTINGVAFFDTLEPNKLANALREHPRQNGPGNYVWDQSGIQFDQMGGSIRFYFDVDEAKKNGFWSERVINQAPLNNASGYFLIYGKELLHMSTAGEIVSGFQTVPTKPDCDGLYPDIRGLAISPSGKPIRVSVEFSRFLPKTVISVTIYVEVKNLKRQEFQLADDEALIATIGVYPPAGLYKLRLVLTDRHLIVRPEWGEEHLHKWDIKDIRGLHLQAPGESWWVFFRNQDRLRVELTSGRCEYIEGPLERGLGLCEKFGQHCALAFEQFIKLVRLVAKRAGAKHEICFSHPLTGQVKPTDSAGANTPLEPTPASYRKHNVPSVESSSPDYVAGLQSSIEKLNASVDRMAELTERGKAPKPSSTDADIYLDTRPPGFLFPKRFSVRVTSDSIIIKDGWWSRDPEQTVFFSQIGRVDADHQEVSPWRWLARIGNVVVHYAGGTLKIPHIKHPQEAAVLIRERIQRWREGS